MKKIFIGIDFSLKSPAICIYNKKYKWLSHCTEVTKPKKNIKIQEDVQSLNDIEMIYHETILRGTDYSSNNNANILNYRLHALKLINLIKKEFTNKDLKTKSFHIGFEGYSFNSFSSSNNIIDIVAATTTFKNMIYDLFHDADYTIDIFSPITIKKYAGYSKLDKVDMFDIFTGHENFVKDKWKEAIDKDHEKKVLKGKPSVFSWNYKDKDIDGYFYKYCKQHEINRSLKKPKVPKPIDDMIDAYFVCSILKDKY